MKHITITLIVLLFIFKVSAQNVTIPDENFKAYLVGNTSINTNADSEIQVTEAEAFTGIISAASLSISDATGLEAFINLQYLDMQSNGLTSIDLSANDQLISIVLNDNSLTSVSGIDGFSNLEKITLDDNSLGSISIHNCTNLEYIELINNNLTGLSLTGSDFNATSSPNDIDISNNPITSIDVSMMSNLKRVIAYSSGLTNLDLTSNSSVTAIFLDYSTSLTTLNVTGLTNLTRIDMRETAVTDLDLTTNTALEALTIRDVTTLSSLDLSQNSSFTYLQAVDGDLNSLDISNGNNTNVTLINIRNNSNLSCVVVDDVAYSNSNWTAKSSNTTYRTECDEPVATSTSPSDEGTYAPLNSSGGIVFNEGVAEASGTIALYLADGTLIESITTGVGDSRLGQPADFRITWDFDTDLIPATDYYILVSAGAYEDLAGNEFPGIGVGELDFTSNARPLIESLSPVDEGTDIALDASLTLDLDVNAYIDGDVDLVIREYDNDNLFESFELNTLDLGFGAGAFPNGTISITPSTDFTEDTKYYVVLEGTGTIKSETNAESFVGLTDKEDWTFTIVDIDNEVPVATSTSPSDEGTYAPLNASGGIVFNESVAEASGTIALYLADGTLVESITTGVGDSRLGQPADFRITWDFDADLVPSTDYYILVSSGAYEDLAGNDFAGIGVGELDFTSNARPLIESLSPADEGVNIALDASLTLDLDVNAYADGDVDLAIREYDNDNLFESFELNTLDLGFGAGSFPNGIITLTPSSDFAETTKYYVLLEGTGTIKSETNAESFIGLSDKDDWTFTTTDVDNEPPVVVSLTPENGASNVEVDQSLVITFDENVVVRNSVFTQQILIEETSPNAQTFEIMSMTFGASSDRVTGMGTSEITIDPTEDFDFGTSYRVRVIRAFDDENGNEFSGLSEVTSWEFTTDPGDVEAPVATSTSPSDEGTFAPLGATGGIVFNESVQEGAGTIALYLADGTLVESISTGVGDTRLGQPADFRITWDFDTDLVPATEYYILVSAGAYEDLAGNDFAGIGAGELDFTSNARPLIVSLNPADESTEVELDATLTLDLDVNVYTDGNIDLAIREYDTDNLFESIELNTLDLGSGAGSFPNGTITVTPSSDFADDTKYYVMLEGSGSIKSETNTESFLGLSDKDDWTFNTLMLDNTPPSIVSINPADNSTDLPINQNFTVTFDEPVQFSELGFIRFKKTEDGSTHTNIPFDQVSVDNGWVSIDGNAVTFHREDYDYNTGYYITFDDGVFEDLAGNPLTGYSSDPEFWNFTTEPIDGPELVSMTPMDNATINPEPKVFTITFDEPVQIDNGNRRFSVFTEDGSDFINTSVGPEAGRVSIDGSVVTITFSGPDWIPGNYYVTLDAGAFEDLDGFGFDGISGTDTWNFSVVVPMMDQVITFDEINDRTFGDDSFTLNATASSSLDVTYSVVSGPVSITGNEVTVNGAGEVTIAADQSGNEEFHPAAQVTQSFTINKADQVITIEAIEDMFVTDESFEVAASVDSELELSYEISGPASLTGTTVTFDGTEGTVTVTVSQAGNDNYNSATSSESFEVSKRDQSISFESIADKTYGDASFTLDASATSELGITYTVVSGPVTLEGNQVSITGAGSVTIAADQSGDSEYNAAAQVTQSFTISKADQEITLEAIEDKFVTDESFEIEASVDSELSLTYEVAGPATLAGTTVSLDGTEGTVTITVSQTGDDNYNAATASESFEVSKREQTITFDAIADKTYGDASFTLDASASSELGIAFSIVSGPISLDGNEVTITGAGTAIIAADQSGDEEYNAAEQVTRSFTISKADQTITITAIEDKLVTDSPFEVIASTDSDLSLDYEVSGPASISGTTITLNGTTGTVTVTVSHDGNDNYNAALATVTFNVEEESVLSVEDQLVVDVYPNPVTDHLIIDSQEELLVKIYDLEGKVLKSQKMTSGRIDVTDLNKGIYILTLQTQETVLKKKLVKN